MSPSVPVVPMYIPGRLRTASSPSRTERLVALYWVASFIAVLVFKFCLCVKEVFEGLCA